MRTYKHITTTAFVFILMTSMLGCMRIEGSGKMTTESRTVSGFTAVSLGGDADIEIEQTGEEALTITADDNILQLLRSDVRAGRLELGPKNNAKLNPTQKIHYKLSVKSLNEITLAGDVQAAAKQIMTDRLTVVMSGDCDVRIDGSTDRQEITITGDGKYEGQNLKSKTASLRITGDGNIKLAVSDKLDVNIIGDGSVEYTGDPMVTKNIIGDGNIRKR
jgi:hypothetical protein